MSLALGECCGRSMACSMLSRSRCYSSDAPALRSCISSSSWLLRGTPAAAGEAGRTAAPSSSSSSSTTSSSSVFGPRLSGPLLRPFSGARHFSSIQLRLDSNASDTKVSPKGSSDAAFQELIHSIRQRRQDLDSATASGPSDGITKLKQDEIELTRKVFQRVDPDRDVTSDLSAAGHDIDPYWNPFAEVEDLKSQVTAEFDEYARFVSVAEAKRTNIHIKKRMREALKQSNPYSEEHRRFHGRERGFDQLPKPFRITDKHWERTPLQSKLGKEVITWRDVDIIQHFMADNGYILPRRTTTLTLKQQRRLVKAVRTAQRMSLIPYQWRLQDYQAMPLMDPLQWMVDRLTDQVKEQKDRRASAMLQVMMDRYPELNFSRFLADKKRLKTMAEEQAARTDS
mmetsp:Transcript_36861/g.78218  ORF Transcript_36861/g.78218 Transcript_36861/m.78218 type:complete len:398 (-) Transcript_36861:33-1226(-)